MSTLVTTAAIVLQTYRYSETSKVVRLATRELGVQSAMAKGVLRPKSKFGAGLEHLAEGRAQLYYRETRDLQTLAEFEVERLRGELARDLRRFAAAAVLAEAMVRMAPPAPLESAFDALVAGLDALAASPAADVDAAGVRAVWRLLGTLGFEPSLTECVRDGAPVHAGDRDGAVAFSAAEGGVLCERCAPAQPPTRLPPQAYRDLVQLNDPRAPLPALDAPHAAAHRRLVARFARHHYAEATALPALELWERSAWFAGS